MLWKCSYIKDRYNIIEYKKIKKEFDEMVVILLSLYMEIPILKIIITRKKLIINTNTYVSNIENKNNFIKG